MSALPTEPLEEPEQELLGIILYRFIVTFLSALLGFVLIPMGYFVISFLDVDVTEFETSSSIYFIISTAIWMLIGLSTPFKSMKRLFEDLKGILTDHVVIFYYCGRCLRVHLLVSHHIHSINNFIDLWH